MYACQWVALCFPMISETRDSLWYDPSLEGESKDGLVCDDCTCVRCGMTEALKGVRVNVSEAEDTQSGVLLVR